MPSKKRVIRICETISEATGRDQTLLDQETVVTKLNRTMIGWANYFCLGPVSKAYRAVEKHACKRLRQWLCGCVPSTKWSGREPSGFRKHLCTKCWASSALPSGRAMVPLNRQLKPRRVSLFQGPVTQENRILYRIHVGEQECLH